MKQIIIIALISISSIINSSAKEIKLYFNTQEFPPFNYSKNNKAAGPVVEILNRVCKKIDIKCVSRVLPWRRAQKEVAAGLADGLFVVGHNKSRDIWLNFSLPIITTEYGFFVLKSNNTKYKSLEDIEGYKIGVFGPSNTSDSLKKINKQLSMENKDSIIIRESHDDILVFKQLNTQRRGLQAVYSNKDVGHELIHKYKLDNLKYLGKQKELNYFIAFSKYTVSKEVVDMFNEVILNMHHNKELQDILSKYNLKSALIK